mmetsp:Transcript_31877/g.69759  ORF Transcript_31877/g.69759 Transcript_31877/m.69759 type:complete len:237 (-) Transcript_31877:429-1139(-)
MIDCHPLVRDEDGLVCGVEGDELVKRVELAQQSMVSRVLVVDQRAARPERAQFDVAHRELQVVHQLLCTENSPSGLSQPGGRSLLRRPTPVENRASKPDQANEKEKCKDAREGDHEFPVIRRLLLQYISEVGARRVVSTTSRVIIAHMRDNRVDPCCKGCFRYEVSCALGVSTSVQSRRVGRERGRVWNEGGTEAHVPLARMYVGVDDIIPIATFLIAVHISKNRCLLCWRSVCWW